MLKHKILAGVGFFSGFAIVLINFASDSSTSNLPISPTVIPSPLPSASPLVTPSPSITNEIHSPTPRSTPATINSTQKPNFTPSAATVPTQKPTASAAAKASTPPSTQTLVGDTCTAGKYGVVQVEITVQGGVVTQARALSFPNGDSRSSSISAVAIPVLIERSIGVVSSESIQGFTGASYTSEAWKYSLQTALNKR